MPFELAQFCKTRPWLYHLTHAANWPRILRSRRMYATAELRRQAGVGAPGEMARRAEMHPLTIEGEPVWLRDQKPLHERHVRFEGGWSFDDLLRDLNARVFFWPGTDEGPIPSGRNHFACYANRRDPIFRVASAALFACNPAQSPLFSRCNSGAPSARQPGGSPRGPQTFLPASSFVGRASDVIEVTFLSSVVLPEVIERWGESG